MKVEFELLEKKFTTEDGREIKYEYDEKGECTELNLNKYGEFTIMDDGFEDDDFDDFDSRKIISLDDFR